MDYYETLFILKPSLDDEERKRELQNISEIVAREGGRIFRTDEWPLRKLAYRIGREREGWYVFLEFGLPRSKVAELVRNLRINESVMRFVVLRKEKGWKPESEEESHG